MRLLRVALAATAVVVALGIAIGALAHFVGGDRAPNVPNGCQPDPIVAGIDVSYYQGQIDWPTVAAHDVKFAFIRVSDGATFADPLFARNWHQAQRAGIARGAYQYFRPDQDAIVQADLMIAAVRAEPGELAPVIDVETDGGLRPGALATRIRVWIDRVRDRLGVEPIIYASPDFWRDAVGGADIPQHLWVAHYTAQGQCPRVPPPWLRWTYWQYSESGRVPGIDTKVDLDIGLASALPVPLAHADEPRVDGGERALARLGRQHGR